MPTYRFFNKETEEEFEDFMSISQLEIYLTENPMLVQMVNGAPALHSGRGMQKPDPAFRDLLKHIKKGNSKGIKRSTINNF